jgi:hypothetical protein
MANRAAVQKTQAKLSAQILLRGQPKRDRNPDLVRIDLTATDGSSTKATQKVLGFFQHGSNRQIPPVQLRPLDQLSK